MTSISDQWRERMDSAPDKWTLEWWRKQLEEIKKGYHGASHAINRCLADYEDMLREFQQLRERCDSLERERDEAAAKIGQLQAELICVRDRQEKMAEWLREHRERITGGNNGHQDKGREKGGEAHSGGTQDAAELRGAGE